MLAKQVRAWLDNIQCKDATVGENPGIVRANPGPGAEQQIFLEMIQLVWEHWADKLDGCPSVTKG